MVDDIGTAEINIIHTLQIAKFKKMLLSFDSESRNVLFTRCIDWFLVQKKIDDTTEVIFQWFQDARSHNTLFTDTEFQDTISWSILYDHIDSEILLNLIKLFVV